MAETERIDAGAPKDVVTHEVTIGGEPLPPTVTVAGMVIHRVAGHIPFATIEIYDGDAASGKWPVTDDARFQPWAEVKIEAGYRSKNEPLFKGVLVGQRLHLREHGRAVLVLHCRHAACAATLRTHSRVYSEISDKELIPSLFEPYGLETEVALDGPIHAQLARHRLSDWDFALSRADANAALLLVHDDRITIAPPAADAEPDLKLRYGATVFEADFEWDARSQPKESDTLYWDPATQETAVAEGNEPGLPEAGNLSAGDQSGAHGESDRFRHGGALAAEEASLIASGRLLVRRLGLIFGRVQCPGNAAPRIGGVLDLTGFGERFSGRHLITGVRHQFSGGRWRTDLQVGLRAAPRLAEAGPLPGNSRAALHIGVVDAMAGDPEDSFRVKVRLPTEDSGEEAVWARMMMPEAGEGRGFFHFPEIDDEVIVAFLEGDPTFPVVLGAVYSPARAAGITPEESNPEKGYISRNGLKCLFNDETRSLRLETPGGRVVLLDDDTEMIRIEDANGNAASFDSDGIRLESSADISISANGDLTLNGMNLNARAEAEAKIEGAFSELSASGPTTVKGSIVQIN